MLLLRALSKSEWKQVAAIWTYLNTLQADINLLLFQIKLQWLQVRNNTAILGTTHPAPPIPSLGVIMGIAVWIESNEIIIDLK